MGDVRPWRALPLLIFRLVLLSTLQPTMSFIAFQTQRLASTLRICSTTATTTIYPTRAFRATPTCGLQINIHIRGKRTGGEEYLNDAYLEYTKRLRPVLELETIWHKTDEELKAAVAKEKAPVICLDERGKQLPSLELADVLYKRLEEGGSRLVFVIGGAEGLPSALKNKELWSLSKLTFTHQWARVLLTEQIYRATEIKKGSGYHKE
ncbi:hypothetical protein VYU27_004178 [Nannochloropsis oceanica]